ncbi:MAG: hypothetical protein V4471_07395 [Pseudomonadota bacterium]
MYSGRHLSQRYDGSEVQQEGVIDPQILMSVILTLQPELDKHRGYKQILGNLLILICTLGTGQLINKAYTGNFLFFKKTDSSKHIDKVSHMIEKMEAALKSP